MASGTIDESPPAIEEADKFDHSSHPVSQPTPGDLRAPGGGELAHPEGRRRTAVLRRDDPVPGDATEGDAVDPAVSGSTFPRHPGPA